MLTLEFVNLIDGKKMELYIFLAHNKIPIHKLRAVMANLFFTLHIFGQEATLNVIKVWSLKIAIVGMGVFCVYYKLSPTSNTISLGFLI